MLYPQSPNNPTQTLRVKGRQLSSIFRPLAAVISSSSLFLGLWYISRVSANHDELHYEPPSFPLVYVKVDDGDFREEDAPHNYRCVRNHESLTTIMMAPQSSSWGLNGRLSHQFPQVLPAVVVGFPLVHLGDCVKLPT
ncbi:hypothetical protein SCLCIDRAFT_248886 [Scleroderma citrinum Foug A]|uniref:Uncharacterized protein n=1 Tax=Scleroderma citrinum Foug A TaxID=1036808 RepID=A0A0C3D653_9AGAM|nr:hypothetical protein SCLCIDRAFT_248886 [Scleroderma citrinum Foug A]